MNSYDQARRESFREVKETCPHVDRAFDEAKDAVKEQTEALRAAHIDALQRAIEAEEERDELRRERDALLDRVDVLEREIRLLEAHA